METNVGEPGAPRIWAMVCPRFFPLSFSHPVPVGGLVTGRGDKGHRSPTHVARASRPLRVGSCIMASVESLLLREKNLPWIPTHMT